MPTIAIVPSDVTSKRMLAGRLGAQQAAVHAERSPEPVGLTDSGGRVVGQGVAAGVEPSQALLGEGAPEGGLGQEALGVGEVFGGAVLLRTQQVESVAEVSRLCAGGREVGSRGSGGHRGRKCAHGDGHRTGQGDSDTKPTRRPTDHDWAPDVSSGSS